MKVAISTSSFAAQNDAPLRLLKDRGVEVVPNPHARRLKEEEIIAHLHEVDGLIAGLEPLNRKVLTSTNRLKAIARVGIGMENVDLKAAAELKIKVSNTPDAPADAVAEMTLAALLSLGRGLRQADRSMHARTWKKTLGVGLKGTTVLLIGYGRIGQRVARLLTCFGSKLLVVEPNLSEEDRKRVEPVELEQGLAQADVISLHASGADTLLGKKEMDRIKDGALVLNCARGGLIDEQALLEALESGKVRGAWLDTFSSEPYEGPLCDYPQVLLTPHISTYTQECRREMETGAVENLCRDLGL